MTWRSSVAAVAALAAAAGGVVLAGGAHPHPTRPDGRVRVEPVSTTGLTCPVTTGRTGLTQPAVAVFAVGPGGSRTGDGPGLLSVSSIVANAGEVLRTTTAAGSPLRAEVTAGGAGGTVRVWARGGLAPGAAAAQVATYRGRAGSGVAATWCLRPRSQWWFDGVDTSAGATTRLVLANPSPAVAVVAVRIFGHAGEVPAPGGGGIAVPPRSRRVFDVARFAPGRPALTVSVTASRGSVVAAALTSRVDGADPAGTEWLPPSASPAATVVVGSGIPGDRQSIAITNTGRRQVLVQLRILGKDGAFTSTSLPRVAIAPGSVVVRHLGAATLGAAAAVVLQAPGPVTATIVSTTSAGVRDVSLASVSEPLTTPAVVPTFAGLALRLTFASALPGLAQVRIRRLDGSGGLLGVSTVAVRGQTTTTWSPPAPSGRTSYLVIAAPLRSDLHAVATYTGPAGITQLPVEPGIYTVVRPAVAPDWPHPGL